MFVYKILLPREWDEFNASGVFAGSPLDVSSGFVHCSSRVQVDATATRFFPDLPVLVVVVLDGEQLGEALRWEPAASGELFPHVYGPLLRPAVTAVHRVARNPRTGCLELSAIREVTVAESTPFTIGAKAHCSDGDCGRVTQVVIDPIDDRVTHLIVEPEHRQGLGRLVPLELSEVKGDRVELRCSRAEFDRLADAEEVRFLEGIEGYQGYEPDQTLLWPYFGGNTSVPVVVDTLPVGEVAIQRGEAVHASDGPIGEVEGLIVDPGNHHVTHVLLKEGHLFGRKEVAIPIHAVTSVTEDGIRLSATKQEIEDLPPADLRRR
jgi:uncharacterized protein (DUF952 family)/sporulation protein YlmC with PRC-barrel domain